MAVIILMVIGAIIGGFFVNKKAFCGNERFKERLANYLAGGLLGFSVVFLSLVLIAKTWPYFEEEIYEYDKIKLVAFSGVSDELQGSIYILSGSIGVKKHYEYYAELADSGKEYGKVSAENTRIYEEE